ncbi:hypothetical protein [Ruegeria atlantica]|uniref:hypothetical protein n=1 Tax=Ruegeria atlantica TaxID=81569 RepID=UPI002494E6C8|nr:hypothetical protein [Ruegeria atlantica]
MAFTVEDYLRDDYRELKQINPDFEREFAENRMCWFSESCVNKVAILAALKEYFEYDELDMGHPPPFAEYVVYDHSHFFATDPIFREIAQARYDEWDRRTTEEYGA